MTIINSLIILASNIFFLLVLYSMYMEILNLTKKSAKEKDENEKMTLELNRKVMILFTSLGVVAYSSYIKFVVQSYTNR